jgi:HPt (histidine-containing phosphotransfer) domain-containing protein
MDGTNQYCAAMDSGEADAQAVVAHLRSLAPEEPGFVRECVEAFVTQTTSDLASLQAALAQGDAAAAAQAAHQIKGGCATVGACWLQALAKQIETRARQGTIAEAAGDLRLLTELFQKVRVRLGN